MRKVGRGQARRKGRGGGGRGGEGRGGGDREEAKGRWGGSARPFDLLYRDEGWCRRRRPIVVSTAIHT